MAYQATNGGQDASSFLLTDSAQTEQVSGIWPSYFGFFYHGTLALTGGIQLGDAFVLSQDPGFGSSSSYWGAMNTILDWEDGPSSYLWVRPWKSGPRQSSVGIAHSLVNGHETIALRTVLESTSTISIQKRDLVFRSSLNGYAGPDIPITPTEDWRDISAAFVMDHPVLPPTAGLGTMTVALDTWPFAAYSQKRTQIYQYHPSPIAGQIGSFVPYKEVLVTAPNQVFALYGATSTHVWGIHDDYSLPGPKVRDWVIVRCP